MNPTVQQARRSLWHVAGHAARWQLVPPPRLVRSFASQAPSASTHAASASNAAEEENAQPRLQMRRATTSSKGFNLMSAHQSTVEEAVQAEGSASAAPWKRAKKDKHRRKNKSKWWADMDRVSFRSLLTQEMASNKVSSVLRKVRASSAIQSLRQDRTLLSPPIASN
jgi:hypothetical protein